MDRDDDVRTSSVAGARDAGRRPTPGLWYWFALTLALLALAWMGFQAYAWLQTDAEQRRAVAEGRAAQAPDLDAVDDQSVPALPALDTQPERPATVVQGEPQAPAVAGEMLNKCLQDGRTVYSRRPCPDGTARDASGTQGQVGISPSGLPSASPRFAGGDRASDHTAICAYLAAEIERLDFEFAQALPPPVLDHISTQIGHLRTQSQEQRCPQSK